MHLHEAYSLCRRYQYRYVRVTTKDGRVYDGFIADVDREKVTLAIPIGDGEETHRGKSTKEAEYRQFGRRRFRRRVLPLILLSTLSLLPFFDGGYPYPYPYPYPYGGFPYYY